MTNDIQDDPMKGDILKGLADSIEKSRKACVIPGMAVAVLFKGELIFAEGFGIRNDQNEPFTPQVKISIIFHGFPIRGPIALTRT